MGGPASGTPPPDAADEAGRDHHDEAVGPPDPFDVAMIDLLDLQDDLARSWCGWPRTGRPTCRPRICWARPRCWPTSHRAAVQLLVPCPDAERLARVAQLLGVPVQDRRPEPDSRGAAPAGGPVASAGSASTPTPRVRGDDRS